MKTTRLKSTPSIETPGQFESLLDATCYLQLDLEKRITKRDREIALVREEHDAAIERLQEQIKSNVLQAEKFAAVHRETLLGKAKSAATSLANYGFRLGNPTLVLLNRKWTWDAVVDALESKDLFRFVVIKKSADKDAIKAHMSDAERAAIGTRITQAETFYIDPKRDEAPDQRLSAPTKEAA